jgi:hypothetical protein
MEPKLEFQSFEMKIDVKDRVNEDPHECEIASDKKV